MGSELTKSELVRRAEAILEPKKLERGFKNATSQLRNLVQIVQTEWDVKVLENFLNYQRGRKATAEFWELIHTDVVRVLRDIDREAATDDVKRKAWVQGFFGYLVRHYVYLDKVTKNPAAAGGGRR